MLTLAVVQPIISTDTNSTSILDSSTLLTYPSSFEEGSVNVSHDTPDYAMMGIYPEHDAEDELRIQRQAEAEKARQEELKRIEMERVQAFQRQIAAEEAARKAKEEEEARKAAARQVAFRRPAPTSVQVNYSMPKNTDFETLINERCARLGCDSQFVIAIMYCESGGKPNAVNRSSGASGLFQQMPQFWSARAAAAGVPGASIFDPYAQIIVATDMISRGMGYHWTNHGCPRK